METMPFLYRSSYSKESKAKSDQLKLRGISIYLLKTHLITAFAIFFSFFDPSESFFTHRPQFSTNVTKPVKIAIGLSKKKVKQTMRKWLIPFSVYQKQQADKMKTTDTMAKIYYRELF
jgi:hypothetical protein